MNAIRAILIRTFIKPYYRQNAGFFLFLFILFFGIVAPSLQLAYHYALILGMLGSPVFFAVVLLAWTLYSVKCSRFVTDTLEKPDHFFLHNLSLLPERTSWRLWLEVQIILYLPVSLYALAVTGVALYKGWYAEAIGVQVFILLVCLIAASWYNYNLRHPGNHYRTLYSFLTRLPFLAGRKKGKGALPYWSVLFRYILTDGKMLYGGIKLFSCVFLYLLLRDLSADDYHLRMPYLLWSFSIFGHGVLLYRIRELEGKRLVFYKGLPVPGLRRLAQYGILYFLLLVPEMLIIGWLTPDPLHIRDGFGWVASAYTLLLLMNSLLFVAPLKMSDFLQLNLVIFGILYGCVLADRLILFAGFLFVLAIGLFFWRYYKTDGGY